MYRYELFGHDEFNSGEKNGAFALNRLRRHWSPPSRQNYLNAYACAPEGIQVKEAIRDMRSPISQQ